MIKSHKFWKKSFSRLPSQQEEEGSENIFRGQKKKGWKWRLKTQTLNLNVLFIIIPPSICISSFARKPPWKFFLPLARQTKLRSVLSSLVSHPVAMIWGQTGRLLLRWDEQKRKEKRAGQKTKINPFMIKLITNDVCAKKSGWEARPLSVSLFVLWVAFSDLHPSPVSLRTEGIDNEPHPERLEKKERSTTKGKQTFQPSRNMKKVFPSSLQSVLAHRRGEANSTAKKALLALSDEGSLRWKMQCQWNAAPPSRFRQPKW